MDLRPRYQKLLADSGGNTEAAYLLARVEPDPDTADRLLRQAAAGKPPSGQAMVSLGDSAMSGGRFADAVGWYEQAESLLPDKTLVRRSYNDALLANREFDRLLGRLESQTQGSGRNVATLREISRVHAIRGDKANSRATLAKTEQTAKGGEPDDDEEWTPSKPFLRMSVCCWDNDSDGYLKAAEGLGRPLFEAAFLRGNREQAAETVKKYGTTLQHALLYLAAERSGAKDLAQAQWLALTEKLAKASRDERLLADVLLGRKSITACPPHKIPLNPLSKRVYLAVVAQRYPELAKDAIALAEKLDFQRDEISLCLRSVLTDEPR